jgi:hypothetical protein
MAIIVRINPNVFTKAVKEAKSLGGTFDGSTKTWKLNETLVSAAKGGDTMNTLAEWLGYLGLKLVETTAPTHEQHDHNCDWHNGGACECDVRTR